MTDKQMIIDVSKCKFYRDDVSFVDGTTLTDVCSIWIWQRDYSGLEPNCIMECHCSDNPNCSYKQLKAKDESYEELRQYHNKCCEDNAKEVGDWLWKYNQSLRASCSGKYCNTEKCQQLAQLKEENDRLRKRIVTIFDCLIKANRDVIVDTLWVDKITTLWDYIAQTLGIEGDQNQIEEQVEMLYSEGE